MSWSFIVNFGPSIYILLHSYLAFFFRMWLIAVKLKVYCQCHQQVTLSFLYEKACHIVSMYSGSRKAIVQSMPQEFRQSMKYFVRKLADGVR